MVSFEERRRRLARARLYFVTNGGPDLVAAALTGGVDVIQLRDKQGSDEEILHAARELRWICHAHGALFLVNDRPDIALEAAADGVHVGQEDVPVEEVQALGPELLIGLSTHSPEQFDAGVRSEVDYLSVGPVHETPTKPGRPAAGIDYVRHAARTGTDKPWFAIGGLHAGNVGEVLAAGAERIVVVRAIQDAEDPRAAAVSLKSALDREERVGA
jgi:thiamine-phosphate pyrophosphorylase